MIKEKVKSGSVEIFYDTGLELKMITQAVKLLKLINEVKKWVYKLIDLRKKMCKEEWL